MENAYNIIIEKTNDWYIGYVEELPGVNSQGETLEEIRNNLKEAIELIITTNRELVKKELSGSNYTTETIKVNI